MHAIISPTKIVSSFIYPCVQSILAVLGEAGVTGLQVHRLLNVQRLIPAITSCLDNDSDQVALDHEEFNYDSDEKDNVEENVAMEDDEKNQALCEVLYPRYVFIYRI